MPPTITRDEVQYDMRCSLNFVHEDKESECKEVDYRDSYEEAAGLERTFHSTVL